MHTHCSPPAPRTVPALGECSVYTYQMDYQVSVTSHWPPDRAPSEILGAGSIGCGLPLTLKRAEMFQKTFSSPSMCICMSRVRGYEFLTLRLDDYPEGPPSLPTSLVPQYPCHSVLPPPDADPHQGAEDACCTREAQIQGKQLFLFLREHSILEDVDHLLFFHVHFLPSRDPTKTWSPGSSCYHKGNVTAPTTQVAALWPPPFSQCAHDHSAVGRAP